MIWLIIKGQCLSCTADVTPPKVELKAPVMSDEGIAVRWIFNEEASSICEIHAPSMLNVTTVPCLNNTVLFTYTQEDYALYIQGIDVEGNVADPVQVTWSNGKGTCTIKFIAPILWSCTCTHQFSCLRYPTVETS